MAWGRRGRPWAPLIANCTVLRPPLPPQTPVAAAAAPAAATPPPPTPAPICWKNPLESRRKELRSVFDADRWELHRDASRYFRHLAGIPW